MPTRLSPMPRLVVAARAAFALGLASLAACNEPESTPVLAVAEPASLAPTAEPPPVPPPTAPPADAGFVISAGAAIFAAEAATAPPPARPTPTPHARTHGDPPTPVRASPPRPAPPVAATAEATAQSVIRRHEGEIEACYGAVALKNPSVAGRVTLRWTLGADGTPSAVAVVNDTLRSAAVTDCMKARAKTWKFPPPGGGIGVVSYPYDLKVQ